MLDTSGIHLAFLGWDDGIAFDQRGENAAGGFDSQRQGVDVDEGDGGAALDAGQDTSLDGCSVSHCLVRIDSL